MRPCAAWLDSEACRKHAVATRRWVDMFDQDTTTPHLFRKDVRFRFQCFSKLFGGRATIGTDVTELSGRQGPTSMLRSQG